MKVTSAAVFAVAITAAAARSSPKMQAIFGDAFSGDVTSHANRAPSRAKVQSAEVSLEGESPFSATDSDQVAETIAVHAATVADVGAALKKASTHNEPVLVASDGHSHGHHIETGLWLDLSRLKQVEVSEGGERVRVQAGAVATDVGRELGRGQAGNVLPLPLNPEGSIIEAVLDRSSTEDHSFFERSLGNLHDRVSKVEYFDKSGEAHTAGSLEALGADASATITAIELNTTKENVWAAIWCRTYEEEAALGAVRGLVEFDRDEYQHDASLLVSSEHFYRFPVPIMCIVTSGVKASSSKHRPCWLDSNLCGSPADRRRSEWREAGKVDGFEETTSLFEELPATRSCNEFASPSCEHYIGLVPESGNPELEGFLADFGRAMDLAVGADDESHHQHVFDSKMVASLHVVGDGKVSASVTFFPGNRSPLDGEVRKLLTKHFEGFREGSLHSIGGGVGSGTGLTTEVLAAVEADSLGSSCKASGFRGQTCGKGDQCYVRKSAQYATYKGSYKREPRCIFVPMDAVSVAAAVSFARDNDLKAVARSGGHQYSGYSSGGDDTVVIDLQHFKNIDLQAPATEDASSTLVTVGAGVSLEDFVHKMVKQPEGKQYSIPHGECPLVGIGGHAQSGGYGHALRSVGLTQDHVESFSVVTADGQTHPKVTAKSDTDLYRAVMGGSPGAFGIVLDYTFRALRKQFWAYSHRKRWTKPGFVAIMDEARSWTERMHGTGEPLPPHVDFFFTVRISKNLIGCVAQLGGVMIVELADSEPSSPKESKVLQPFVHQLEEVISPPGDDIEGGSFSLAELNMAGLRERGTAFMSWVSATTEGGREFDLPYVKRVNGFNQPLTSGFIKDLANLVQGIYDEPCLGGTTNMVIQFLVGGAAAADTSSGSMLPHRGITWCIVFDIFYKPGHKDRANELQKKMGSIMWKHYPEDKDNVRLFWGSFGQTDLSKTDNDGVPVWKKYFQNETHYDAVRELKTKLDEGDLFSTPFFPKPKP